MLYVHFLWCKMHIFVLTVIAYIQKKAGYNDGESRTNGYYTLSILFLAQGFIIGIFNNELSVAQYEIYFPPGCTSYPCQSSEKQAWSDNFYYFIWIVPVGIRQNAAGPACPLAKKTCGYLGYPIGSQQQLDLSLVVCLFQSITKLHLRKVCLKIHF